MTAKHLGLAGATLLIGLGCGGEPAPAAVAFGQDALEQPTFIGSSRINLVPDPGLEGENRWTLLQTGGSTASSTRDAAIRHGGQASRMVAKSNAQGFSELVHVPVTFRRSVRHFAYAFVLGESGSAGKAQMVLSYFDAAGVLLQSSPGMAVPAVPEWQWLSVRAEPPPGARTVQVSLRLHGQARVWWDDATLRIDADGPNAAPNPSFEWDGSWEFRNMLGSTGGWSRSTASAGFGKVAARIEKTNEPGYALLFARGIVVTHGSPYVVSALVKGSGTVSIALQYRDAAGGWLAVRESPVQALLADWRLVERIDTPPAGARTVEILLKHQTPGISYWDEVELRNDSDVHNTHSFVTNGMFERDGGWRMAQVGGSAGAFAYNTATTRSGLRSAQLSKDNVPGYQLIHNDPLPTIAARTHEAAAFVRGDASARVRVILQYRDADNDWLKAVEGPLVTPQERWTRVAVSAAPPANAAFVQVLLKLETPAVTWWDDVSLTVAPKRKGIHIDVDVSDQLAFSRRATAFRSPDDIRLFFEQCRARGVTRANWRLAASGLLTYPTQVGTPFTRVPTSDEWAFVVNPIADAMERFDPLAEAVRYAHQNGIELYAWFDILDNGRSDLPGNSNYRSRFVNEHPELQTVSREIGGVGAVNLVPTPGFEVADNVWRVARSDGPYGPVTRDASTARSGGYSARLEKTTAGGWVRLVRSDSRSLYGSPMLTAGAYVKGTGGRARVHLQFRDASGAWLANYPGPERPIDGSWRYLTSDVIPPADAAAAQIIVEALDPGTYWVDDVAINNQVHWGALSPAYPQVREHFRALIAEAIGYGVDGIELMIGHSHNGIWQGPGSSTHGFQDYGFNPPIVAAFQQRHGVNLLNATTFDRDAWRRIHGEFLTTFLTELRPYLGNVKLLVGMELGSYADNTLSHQHLDWERWVADGLVDGLMVATRFNGLNDSLRSTLEKVLPYREATRRHGAELVYQLYLNRRAAWLADAVLEERSMNLEEISRLAQMDVEALAVYELLNIDAARWDDISAGIANAERHTAPRLTGLSALSAAGGATASSGPTVAQSWTASLTQTADFGRPGLAIDDHGFEDLSYKDLKPWFWQGVGMPNHLTVQLPHPTYLQELLLFVGNPHWGSKCDPKDFVVEAWDGSAWVPVRPAITNAPSFGGGSDYTVNHAVQLRFPPVWTDRIRLSVTASHAPGGQLVVREIMGF